MITIGFPTDAAVIGPPFFNRESRMTALLP
jgi:hypothetical protein